MSYESVKAWVDKKIADKKVVVFSKTYCPFCAMAKQALKPYNIAEEDYEEVEIENRPDCEAIQDYFLELTKARTVPRVFINGKFAGDGTKIKKLHQDNKLQSLLDA